MRNFQDAFETSKRSFIDAFSIYMTVPLNRDLNSPSCSVTHSVVFWCCNCGFICDICVWQFPFRGQLSFHLQLQCFCCWVGVSFKNLQLCCLIRFFILVVQLWLRLMVLLLKILLNLWCFGKCFLISFKNCRSIFVFTCLLHGRSNHTVLLFLPFLSVCCSLKFKVALKLLLFKAFS